MNDIKEKLMGCLDKNGIDLNNNSSEIDSISFITAVVDIEQEFGIELPDEFLLVDTMSSFDKLYEVVKTLVDNMSD